MSKAKTRQEKWFYQFEQVYLKIAVKERRAPTFDELNQAGFPDRTVTRKLGDKKTIYDAIKKKHPSRMLGIPLDTEYDVTPKKKEIAITYAKKFKEIGRVPTWNEVDINTDTTIRLFGGMEGLHKYARQHHPSYFFDIDVETLNTPKHFKKLESAINKGRRFIVTTAVEGCPADENFLKSVRTYCVSRNATLLVLMCADPAARGFGTQVDAVIPSYGHFVLEDTELNKNLFISTIKVSAKQIEPLTGLLRIGQRNGSMILASPKQQLKLVATSHEKLPHALMTTGACTKPNYDTDKYMSERTAYIAMHDHVVGGVIVEIEDDRVFHFRQIQADSKGQFADLGMMYAPDGKSEYSPEAIVPGDWHTQQTDEHCRAILLDEIVPTLKPKKMFLHDFFDGLSVNHHERKSIIKRAQRAHEKKLGLQDEVETLAGELSELSTIFDDLYIVKSNHDLFLSKYLENGWHMQDPQNTVFGALLMNAAISKRDPLMFGVECVIGAMPDNVRWLTLNDDVRIGGVQMAAHGHLGPNGLRNASPKALEQAYGQCMTGHAHTPEIIRGAWRVGTMSKLRLGYNDGPSSWMHTIGLVYKNGSRQLINIVDGKWRLK